MSVVLVTVTFGPKSADLRLASSVPVSAVVAELITTETALKLPSDRLKKWVLRANHATLEDGRSLSAQGVVDGAILELVRL